MELGLLLSARPSLEVSDNSRKNYGVKCKSRHDRLIEVQTRSGVANETDGY